MKNLVILNIICVMFTTISAQTVYANDITVLRVCSLADAIRAANTDSAVGTCPAGNGADTIRLTRNITLDAELPQITSEVTIEGHSHTISGDNSHRIFYVTNEGSLTTNNVVLTLGKADEVNFGDQALAVGGAIYNEGTLSMGNSSFTDNSAESGGGAIGNIGELSISNSSFTDNSAEGGGAILNYERALTITESRFTGNLANIGGAILNHEGTLSITDSDFTDNSAESGGGAIGNSGMLIISDSNFTDNSSDGGGAIYSIERTLSITDSTFTGNWAKIGGVILNYEDTLIIGGTFTSNSAELSGGAIYNSEGDLEITDTAFSKNSAKENEPEDGGGAIFNNLGTVDIGESILADNSAIRGGAIYNNEGTLTIGNSDINGNSANFGGGIRNTNGTLTLHNSNLKNNSVIKLQDVDESGLGGAIHSYGEAAALNVSGSTLSGNSAEHGGGAILVRLGQIDIRNSNLSNNKSSVGGGGALAFSDGSVIVSNSTLIGNSAEAAGGIAIFGGTATLTHLTLAKNSASLAGAGITIDDQATVNLRNSIIALSGGGDCFGRFNQDIGNLIQDGSCLSARSGSPSFGTLVEPEDGSPAYFPLLVGSPAIDTANPAYCMETDQRGVARPQGDACDIGAYEYVPDA